MPVSGMGPVVPTGPDGFAPPATQFLHPQGQRLNVPAFVSPSYTGTAPAGTQLFYSSAQFQSTVAADNGSSLQINAIGGLPRLYPFKLLLEWGTSNQEVAIITSAPTGNGPYTFTGVLRGQDGGGPQITHSAGAQVNHGVSAADFFQIAPVFNVCAYGADPTGAVDSTAAIQAALNAAGKGQVVYAPTGTYLVSSTLTIPAGVVFRGDAGPNPAYWGDTATVIKAKSSFSGAAILYLPDVSSATTQGPSIQHLAIDGSAQSSGTTDGIRSSGPVVEVFLFDVSISGMTGWGINTTQDTGVSSGASWPLEWNVKKVFVQSCATGGISLTSMTDATWEDVYVLACGGGIASVGGGSATGPGWKIIWAGNSHFTNCRAEWNGTYGWWLTGTWFTGTGAGGLSMTGCSSDRNNYDGLHIDATGAGPAVITGYQSRRDGSNGGSGGGSYAGINVASANIPVIMSGLTVFPGVNDDGSGTNSPQFGLSVTSSNIVTIESGYIQAATTAVNSSSNTTFWIGPAVVTAVGTTASPGTFTSQQTNSNLKVNGHLTTANNTLDDGSGNLTVTGGITCSTSGDGFVLNGGGKTWQFAVNGSTGYFVAYDQTDNQTPFSALASALYSANNTLDDGSGNATFSSLTARAGSASVAPLTLTSGTSLTTAAAGAVEFDGAAFYATAAASSRQVVDAEQFQCISGTYTLTNSTSAQQLFNATATGALTVQGSTAYWFECEFDLTSLSASSHTISFGFALGSSASVTSIKYLADSNTGAAGTFASWVTGIITSASATQIHASANTTTTFQSRLRGIIRINHSGTITPQVTMGTNAAAAVVGANSWIRLWAVGSNTVTNVGDWS